MIKTFICLSTFTKKLLVGLPFNFFFIWLIMFFYIGCGCYFAKDPQAQIGFTE